MPTFIPVENIWKVHKKPITNNQEYLFSKIPYKSDELSLSLSLVWLILVAAQSLTCSETIDSQFCMVFYWIDILTTAELGRGVLFPACWGGKEKRFLPCEGHWQSAMVKILDRPESSLRFFHKIVGTYRTGAKRGFTLKGAHKAACTLEQGQQQ